MNYRIVEVERVNGSITYVLEKEMDDGEWKSVWANEDLDAIREAKKKYETRAPLKRRVLEE